MNENLEIEYKVTVTKEEYDRVLSRFTDVTVTVQTNHYFRAAGSDKVFRMRDFGDHVLFTHKKKASGGRLEHEVVCAEVDPNKAPEVLEYLAREGMFPPFKEVGSLTTVRREVKLPKEADLCLDENHYGKITDYEIEYEITGYKGRKKNFRKILEDAGIVYQKSPMSKQARAIQEKSRLDSSKENRP